MKHTIANSRSLVTGASGGIGRAIAMELARRGSQVVLFARREDRLRQLAEQIARDGGRAEYIAGDVTEASARGAALNLAQQHYGGLDILVNNAGRGAMGRFVDSNPQRMRELFETNFFATAEMIREALPMLRQGRRPAIVNIGSILSHRATPRNSEYCATKFALRGLTESLRAELATIGIDVLLITPGTTETEFYEHVVNPAEQAPWPQQKGVSADAVARATVRAIERGTREIVPNRRGRMLLWANRLLPGFVDRAMRKYG